MQGRFKRVKVKTTQRVIVCGSCGMPPWKDDGHCRCAKGAPTQGTGDLPILPHRHAAQHLPDNSGALKSKHIPVSERALQMLGRQPVTDDAEKGEKLARKPKRRLRDLLEGSKSNEAAVEAPVPDPASLLLRHLSDEPESSALNAQPAQFASEPEKLQYAGFLARCCAAILDLTIVCSAVIVTVIVLITPALVDVLQGGLYEPLQMAATLALWSVLLVPLAYTLACERSPQAATVGKRLMRLAVAYTSNRQLPLWRTAMKPSLTAALLLVLYVACASLLGDDRFMLLPAWQQALWCTLLIMAAVTPHAVPIGKRRQTVLDWICGRVVILREAPFSMPGSAAAKRPAVLSISLTVVLWSVLLLGALSLTRVHSSCDKLLSASILVERAVNELEHHNRSRAIALAREAKGILPGIYWIHEYLGDRFQKLPGGEVLAEAHYRRVQLLEPKYARIFLTLADLHRRAARPRSVIQDLLQFKNRIALPNKGQLQDLCSAHILLAREYARQNSLDKALHECNIAIDIDPQTADYYMLRADIYRALGKQKEAAKDSAHAVRSVHHNYHHYQWCMLSSSDTWEDVAQVNASFQTNPDGIVPSLERANYYAITGLKSNSDRLVAKALAEYRKALRRQSSDWQIIQVRAQVGELLGEIEQAIADCEMAIRLYPLCDHAYRMLGSLYEDRDARLAVAYYAKGLEIEPFDDESTRDRLAQLHFRQGQWQRAVAVYDEGLRFVRDPYRESRLRRGRALAYQKLGKHSQAVFDATEALKLDETALELRTIRARSLMAMQRSNEAMADLNYVIEAATADHAEAHHLRARLHSQLGLHDLAKQDLEAARKLGYSEADHRPPSRGSLHSAKADIPE